MGTKRKRTPIVWGEAHKVEAHRSLYRWAAELSPSEATWMTGGAGERSERRFREALASTGKPDPARIDREVRRVDGLATGRLVRQTTWEARRAHGSTEEHEGRGDALAVVRRWQRQGQPGARFVRVTRIRVAS